MNVFLACEHFISVKQIQLRNDRNAKYNLLKNKILQEKYYGSLSLYQVGDAQLPRSH